MSPIYAYRYAECLRREAVGGPLPAYYDVAYRTHLAQAYIAQRMGMRVGLREHLDAARNARRALKQIMSWPEYRRAS